MRARLAAIAACALLVSACGASVTIQILPIAMPLPEREEAVYRVQDKDGAEIGRAVFSITTEGADSRFAQDYDFGNGQIDRSSVTMLRDSMRPRSGERFVQDGSAEYRTLEVYEPEKVTVTFTDARRERQREADIAETAYSNLQSLALWRTLPMGAGERFSFVNVVVDPKRGTISRALATVEVSGREQVRLPSGVVEAWRVDFRSAGVTNQAWYAVDGTRPLVKYAVQRGPTLLLERATP